MLCLVTQNNTHSADSSSCLCLSAPARWAERGAVGYDSLAVDGFMVLGERLRSAEERSVVVEVLEQVMRVSLDMEQVGEKEGGPQAVEKEGVAEAPLSPAARQEVLC